MVGTCGYGSVGGCSGIREEVLDLRVLFRGEAERSEVDDVLNVDGRLRSRLWQGC